MKLNKKQKRILIKNVCYSLAIIGFEVAFILYGVWIAY